MGTASVMKELSTIIEASIFFPIWLSDEAGKRTFPENE